MSAILHYLHQVPCKHNPVTQVQIIMDTSVSTRKLKKTKLLEGQNNHGTEDRLSCLPDGILVFILSLLPTRCAVLTSVLSRRWMFLWTSVPNLEFDFFKCRRDENEFMNIVDRVLLHNDVSNLHQFSLSCNCSFDGSRVNAWISTVLKRKVQQLSLLIGVDDPYVFPRRLFTCDTLVILQIDSSYLNLPSLIRLASLKVLHLYSIVFSCDHSSQQVSFNLPMLREFIMEDCQWLELKIVNIIAPALKSWILDDYEQSWNDGIEIRVYAQSLKYMNLETNLTNKLSLYNLSSLATASIDMASSSGIDAESRLLTAICNIQNLTLSDCAVMVLSRTALYAHWLTFSSLLNLKVIVDLNWAVSAPVNLRIRKLVDLLCHLPNIVSFFFSSGSTCFEEDEYSWATELIPQSVLSHLKSVHVERFYGSKHELYLVEVLLKIAKALEKITIISSSELLEDPKKQIEVAKHLLAAPKESKCVINFT